jgi:hypothetical protein
MVGVLGVLAYGLASAATTVDISVPSWNERYFSPNGDEQDDTVTVSYCLGQSANVTSTVTDEAGTRVRTLEDAVSHAGNSQCTNNQVTWDGKDDAGTQVTIQGANLLGATSVTFNRVKSTQFTVNSSSGITATVPPGARTGFIEVTSPLGTAKSKSKFTVH